MEFLGSYWFLSLCVICSVAIAIAGLYAVRRRWPDIDVLRGHHEVSSAFMSIVGTLYAVVLGFIVVDALNTFQSARQLAEQEANALHDVFHIAEALPSEQAHLIRALVLTYSQSCVQDEWPAMQHGESSTRSHELMSKLWTRVVSLKPTANQESNAQQAMLEELKTVGDARHSRLLAARPTYGGVLWFVLIAGGIVVIAFTYLFGMEKMALQMVMTGSVTFMISLNLVVVAMFGYPYSGDVHVKPTAFQAAIDTYTLELSGQ